ncbi:MAG: peptide deformylase [Alphaproteobacteria bacterium]|nr:peptide deformylase [Alphaproteobacteria bacterium]
MAILKIARMGHPVLARRAELVPDPRAPEIQRLIADMIETMEDADGTGLAAPQVHVPLRVVVFKVNTRRLAAEAPEGERAPEGIALTAMINPVIEPLTETIEEGWEGCLSLPGLAGKVPRLTAIRYRFLTPAGETVTREARGFHARVVQHECDHLDGLLYPMRMTDMASFGFVDDLSKGAPDAAETIGE